jgi:hypothetical protein
MQAFGARSERFLVEQQPLPPSKMRTLLIRIGDGGVAGCGALSAANVSIPRVNDESSTMSAATIAGPRGKPIFSYYSVRLRGGE